MIKTEHGNKLITNPKGTILNCGKAIGFHCPYCDKENVVSMQATFEEPIYCFNCGKEIKVITKVEVEKIE